MFQGSFPLEKNFLTFSQVYFTQIILFLIPPSSTVYCSNIRCGSSQANLNFVTILDKKAIHIVTKIWALCANNIEQLFIDNIILHFGK